jgi:hypothetical protein
LDDARQSRRHRILQEALVVNRSLAIGSSVQKSLIGEVQAFVLEDIESFGLTVRRSDPERIRATMLDLYDRSDDPLDLTTRQAFDAAR